MVRSTDQAMSSDDFADDFADNSDSAFEQFDLQHYLRILRKYKLPITFFTAAVTCLAAYYAYTATPIYRATSTLLIESQNNSPISFEELVGSQADSQDYYETQFELLKSRGLALRVVKKLNLWEDPELSGNGRGAGSQVGDSAAQSSDGLQSGLSGLMGNVKSTLGIDGGSTDTPQEVVVDLDNAAILTTQPDGPGQTGVDQSQDSDSNSDALPVPVSGNEIPAFDFELTEDSFGGNEPLTRDQQIVVSGFMSRMAIEPVRRTKLVKISYESSRSEHAALVANTIGEEYINSYLDAKLELTTRASTWLNSRLIELKGTLDESEDRLIQFKQDNGLVDVGGSVGRLNEQELLLVTAELAQARSDLSAKADLYNEVQALRDQPDLLESLPAFQADPLVQRVKIDQGQAQRTLDELLNRYGERHPRVVDANSQLATLNLTLAGHVARVAGSVANEFQLAQQRVASIQAKLSSGKTEIQAIGSKKFELDSLEREVATNRSIYDTFFSRINEAKSADGLETANARISDYALPPVSAFKPKKQLIIALAALASLVLSMLMAFLYEQLDETVKGTHDVESRLGLKLLGILPLIKGGIFNRQRELPLSPLEIDDKKRTFTESVNTARTAICLADGAVKRKIIVITSSVPGEGKSTAAINLAYSLSQMEKVLLIDCDMRRPTLAKAAGFDKSTNGLSNLITQTASAKNCIVRGVFDGALDLLPSGPIPDQPLELLSSKRFEKILNQLTRHYDRIVIDSAPTQAVSDALVLAKHSDAVVYVIKSHDTSIELAKRGTQRLLQIGAPLSGVLITQVDIDKITAYGGDYYYQGYYDYYGYHDKDEKEDSKRSARAPRQGKLRLTQEELMDIRTDNSEVHLDLDYGIGREDPLDKTDEFDYTTRMDAADFVPPRPGARSRRAGPMTSRRQRHSDDLDIDIL